MDGVGLLEEGVVDDFLEEGFADGGECGDVCLREVGFVAAGEWRKGVSKIVAAVWRRGGEVEGRDGQADGSLSGSEKDWVTYLMYPTSHIGPRAMELARRPRCCR